MKSIQKAKTILFGAFFLSFLSAQSQNFQGQLVLQTNIGYSLTSNIIKTGLKFGVPINAKTSPVGIISADYAMRNYYSLGAAYSMQTIDATLKDYDYFYNNLDSIIIENVKINLTRSHYSILPKYHFLHGSNKFDVYAGLRLGFVHWKTKFETTDPNFKKNLKYFTGRPSIGLITGMRMYLIKGFGANFELNIGAPYVVSAGLTFRFGGREGLE